MLDYSDLAKWVGRAKQGECAAFEELYNRTSHFVHALALSILHNPYDAEDVMQIVFTKVYQHLESLRDDASFIRWLHTVTCNACKDFILRNHRELQPELLEAEELIRPDAVEEWVACQNRREKIRRMMDALPENQRRAATLFYFHELPVNSIALLEGCPPNTVKSRLRYARLELQKALNDEEARSGDRLY